jgi:uncharacterized protein (DUF302 family)
MNDNYFLQISSLRDHALSFVKPDFVTYQLTITCRRETAWKKSEVKKVIENIYKRICERFVHHRNYASPKFKHLMPLMFAIIETDDKVLSHVHALVAVSPEIAEKFDALVGYDTFKHFETSVKTSHFSHTIADAIDIENFDEPTNLEKWFNYMMKQNRETSPKTQDDALLFAPKCSERTLRVFSPVPVTTTSEEM